MKIFTQNNEEPKLKEGRNVNRKVIIKSEEKYQKELENVHKDGKKANNQKWVRLLNVSFVLPILVSVFYNLNLTEAYIL